MSDQCPEIIVTTAPDLLTQGVPPACGTDPDPRCLDPEFALDNPSICANSSPLASLEVLLEEGNTEVGSKYGFRAIAHYENGATKDVTETSAWQTTNQSVGAVFSPGLISGVGVGTTTVKATYRGMFDSAILNVTSQCVMYGLDVAIVVDRSSSMLQLDGSDTRLEKAVAAAKDLVSNLQVTDQSAVVSFGGIIKDNGDGTLTKLADATVNGFLTTDKFSTYDSLDAIAPNTPCSPDNATLNCATGIGAGIQRAVTELNSGRAQGGTTQKVIVVLTDGAENICVPDPVTEAAAAKADGFLIIVVALSLPDEDYTDCNGDYVSVHTVLNEISSSGMTYYVDDADELADIFSRIPQIICDGGYGYYGYYYIRPPDEPHLDQLDYTGFANWVVAGCVDLIGRDLWIFFPPSDGHGAYVDLRGTGCVEKETYLLSREFFTILPGNYRVSLDVAGNQRVKTEGSGLGVRVTLGNSVDGYVLDQTVFIADYKQPFTKYTFDFYVGSPTNGPLRIISTQLPDDFPSQVGPLVDNILFANTDTSDIILYDDFESEHLP